MTDDRNNNRVGSNSINNKLFKTEIVMEFRRINMNTKQGLKEGERLQSQGWVICGIGFEMVTFSKGNSNKH